MLKEVVRFAVLASIDLSSFRYYFSIQNALNPSLKESQDEDGPSRHVSFERHKFLKNTCGLSNSFRKDGFAVQEGELDYVDSKF